MLIVANSLPFIAMMDWNNTPSELADTGWLQTVDEYIISPDTPTCCTNMANAGRIIDYAVISTRLTPMVEYIIAHETERYEALW